MKVNVYDYRVPTLKQVADVLREGLKTHFKEVSVDVAPCPDLTKAPFHLAAAGLGGSPRICDVGGVPYLLPLADKEKTYNLNEIAKLAEVPEGFLIGAGAGPCKTIGVNSELMPNIKCGGATNNETHYIKIDDEGKPLLEKIPSADCSLMCNAFLSEGKPGDVLHINVKCRLSEDNLTTALRRILSAAYGSDRPVGLGGVFLIKKGTAKLHIMPDFSKEPLNSEEDVDKWLKYFEFPAPLICLSILSSSDPGWDLRIDHTHCFSTHGAGGHYHYDTTPKEVEYDCYFNVAQKLYRIDAPEVTHNIGRN